MSLRIKSSIIYSIQSFTSKSVGIISQHLHDGINWRIHLIANRNPYHLTSINVQKVTHTPLIHSLRRNTIYRFIKASQINFHFIINTTQRYHKCIYSPRVCVYHNVIWCGALTIFFLSSFSSKVIHQSRSQQQNRAHINILYIYTDLCVWGKAQYFFYFRARLVTHPRIHFTVAA